VAAVFLDSVGILHRLGGTMKHMTALLAVIVAVIALIELHSGAVMRRYLTRNFLNDVLYGLFYHGGFYTLFVYDPIFNSMRPKLALFDVHFLNTLPTYASLPLFYLITDLFGYWIHRLQHTRYFWPFHSVRHAPQQLTCLAFSRFHLVDQFIANLSVYIPLLLLGAPPKLWLPIRLLQWFLQGIQHAELDWRFGPLYGVIAGPVFHSVHHSTERQHFSKNFGMAFSFWDFLFGTAVTVQHRCQIYGVAGLDIPENILVQFATPFRLLHSEYWSQPQRKQDPQVHADDWTTSHRLWSGFTPPSGEVLAVSTVFLRSPAVEMAPLQDETILFHTQTNQFCVLNRTATFLWKELEAPASGEALAERLCQNFGGVALEAARRDADRALSEMVCLNFVVTNHTE
jgi:sterol desaturase/sphingolipid hydroxylase (fatty acid hydroxylase superfamily)